MHLEVLKKVKIECPNCGCLHKFIIRRDIIKDILEEFKLLTDVLSCTVIDEDGFVIASMRDKSIDKSIDKKILLLHSAMRSFSKNLDMSINYSEKIDTYSFFEEANIHLNKFIMLVSSISNGISLITIIPSWLNLTEILPEFKKMVKKISKYLNENKNNMKQEYVECKLIL